MEKRFYKITIPNPDGGENLLEAFYARHGLNNIKADAAKLIGDNGDGLTINHQTMNASDFYNDLEAVERERGDADSRRLKGGGHRWVVKPVSPEGDV